MVFVSKRLCEYDQRKTLGDSKFYLFSTMKATQQRGINPLICKSNTILSTKLFSINKNTLLVTE